MTNQHPIQPSPELVSQWRAELPAGVYDGYAYPQRETELCIQSAQWGADQELEACCEWLDIKSAGTLRRIRRFKPPSLKQQALRALRDVATGANEPSEQRQDLATIRQALEALPNGWAML